MPLAQTDFISPPDVIGVTTSFFNGEIGLDPATSLVANNLVSASKFFTKEDNGLTQPWKSQSVYLYPPRDLLSDDEQPRDPYLFKKRKRFQRSAQRIWLETCLEKYRKNEFEEAIVFLTSSEVALLTTQKIGLDLPLCICKERPELFIDEPGMPPLGRTRCFGFIYYFPASINTETRMGDFINAYSELGRIYY
tara:strand:- start:474 stop:1052 length:579 start_codon:yes stop_codon:yes gene_type:complete